MLLKFGFLNPHLNTRVYKFIKGIMDSSPIHRELARKVLIMSLSQINEFSSDTIAQIWHYKLLLKNTDNYFV